MPNTLDVAEMFRRVQPAHCDGRWAAGGEEEFERGVGVLVEIGHDQLPAHATLSWMLHLLLPLRDHAEGVQEQHAVERGSSFLALHRRSFLVL